MSYNDYAISIIGLERWKELVKKHKLCTKKWTIGRCKDFYKEVDYEIRCKIKNDQKKIKQNNIFKSLLNKILRKER